MNRRTITADEKRVMLKLVSDGTCTARDIEHVYGVSRQSISQWQREVREHGPLAFPGCGNKHDGERRAKRSDCHLPLVYQYLVAED